LLGILFVLMQVKLGRLLFCQFTVVHFDFY